MKVTTHTEGRVVTHEHDEPIEVVQLPNRDAANPPIIQGTSGANTSVRQPPAARATTAKTPAAPPATPPAKAATKQRDARVKKAKKNG